MVNHEFIYRNVDKGLLLGVWVSPNCNSCVTAKSSPITDDDVQFLSWRSTFSYPPLMFYTAASPKSTHSQFVGRSNGWNPGWGSCSPPSSPMRKWGIAPVTITIDLLSLYFCSYFATKAMAKVISTPLYPLGNPFCPDKTNQQIISVWW